MDKGHYHNWTIFELWGVVFGLSKCKICGVKATPENVNEYLSADRKEE